MKLLPLRNLFIISALIFTFSSCENDLNVAADWKEVPVVYGLLDPAAPYNYLRINRAYLNQTGDAISYAGTSDSIQFETLTVTLVERKNGVETNSYVMEKVNGDTIGLVKEPGLFSSTPNILYRTDQKINATNLYDTYSYDLVIVSEKSGKIYRAKTETVGPIFLVTPRLNRVNPVVFFSDEADRYIYINFQEGFKAAMYDLVIRFRYKEYLTTDPTNVAYDSIDWIVFKGRPTKGLDGRGEQIVTTESKAFYEYLEQQLPTNPNLTREAIDLDFIFYGAGEDIFTYIEVNKPSIGIVQKKPEYSNIENGIGVFSSVHINRYQHILISPEMKSRLTNSPITKSLNFVTR